ncbi:MAG: hypothetical protein ACP5D2_03440 [Candidatus Nanoarchaeia archaeon]
MEIKEAIKEVTKYKDGKPLSSYQLTYDAPSAQLEPIYFWLLDFLDGLAGDGIEKITDNFTASPGSGQFTDFSQRQSRLRQEAMNTFGAINQVLKSIIQLLYDLKEFEVRLGHYEAANSEEKEKKESGILALKQIWLDNVDMKKGNTAIKAMTFSQNPFATLLDAFMIIQSEKDVDGMDLNDRVKRILKQRIQEFNRWREMSEKELRKRFNVQKAYLRSQVETLKLYTAWARPYLKSAQQLNMSGFEKDPALVNAFSTTKFELTLLGKSKLNFEKAIQAGDLPESFSKYKPKRDYFSCLIIGLRFRGFPQKVTQQHYGFGGRVDMTFDSYALNSEELELLHKKLDEKDLEDTFNLAQKSTDESLEQLKEDIEHFLEEDKQEEKKKQEKNKQDINPFSALLDIFKPKKKEKQEISKQKDIKKDNYIEKQMRKLAEDSAKSKLYSIYDIYKKAHGMASAPGEGFDK